MQIQLNDVRGGERSMREIGEEEFVDNPCTRDANGTLLFACRMRCHDHAAEHALGSHRDLRTIVEAAHDLAFWALLELIGGKVQTCLDQRMIKGSVFLATGD